MRIINLKNIDVEKVRKFVQPYEVFCVNLAYLIRKNDEHVYIVLKETEEKTKNEIYGVFYFDSSIHYCFPFLEKNQKDLEEFKKVFIEFIKNSGQKIKVMNGRSCEMEVLLNILKDVNEIPFQINKYQLLVLNRTPVEPPEKLHNDDCIKRCVISDQEQLFKLQKDYLEAEVAPKGKNISDLECNVILKQILKNQICLGLCSDEEFVAKANTNAIGWNYVQIGGVYTNPLYRRNYYAWHLVSYLGNLLIEKEKKVCLFVNDKNLAAINLYKKSGFESCDRFQICYF